MLPHSYCIVVYYFESGDFSSVLLIIVNSMSSMKCGTYGLGRGYNVSNTNGMRLLFTSIYAYKVVVNRQAAWVGELPETGGRLNCTYYSQSVLS